MADAKSVGHYYFPVGIWSNFIGPSRQPLISWISLPIYLSDDVFDVETDRTFQFPMRNLTSKPIHVLLLLQPFMTNNNTLKPSLSATREASEESNEAKTSDSNPRTKTQAEAIFEKFGNASRLCAILKALGRPYNKATLYKWTYPRTKGGTNGWVPTKAWPDVLAAARYFGVFITSEEMDPRSYIPRKPFN